MKNISTIIVTCLSLLIFSAGLTYAQNPTHLKWREYETDHFIVYYPEGQELTAYQSIEIAEKVHESLVEMYGTPNSKISIVVKDTEDYANGGAFFFDNKIEISATHLDYDFRSYSDWLWNVVTHELTHIYSLTSSMKLTRRIPMVYYQHIDYQDEKREDVLQGYPNVLVSYPLPTFNVPAWLAEGVAQYQTRSKHFDSWDSHRDMIVRLAILNDKMLSFDQMGIFNWNGRENEMVYNHGYSLIRYISETYGDESLTDLMKAMSDPLAITFDVACRRALDISQDELYSQWIDSLKDHYDDVEASLGTLIEGETFRKGGFINGFPTWSPDGSKLAYVTNRGQDYSITYARVANFAPGGWKWKKKEKAEQKQLRKLKETKEKKPDEYDEAALLAMGSFDIALAAGIQSAPIWLDEGNILFNRRMPSDKYGSHWWDMYRYVINTKDPREGSQERISHNLRGTYPDLSPDKSELVFVKNSAGLNNLYIMKRDDNSIEQITFYDDGTQIYRPRFSPDGTQILFTINSKDQVNIASINRDGSGFNVLVNSAGHDRDAVWMSGGESILFSSDVTGIPNLYRMNLNVRKVRSLTNVIGAAFSPAPSPGDSTLAFSYYGADGYEIRTMPITEGKPVANSDDFHVKYAVSNADESRIVPISESKPYTMKTLDFSFMPVVRNDRGNVKIGSYIMKSEVIDKGSFFVSGAISPVNKDTDMFAQFEYKRFIPTVFIEMYRQTRSVGKNENFMEEYGTVIRKRIFDLNEIDFGMRYLLKDRHEFEGRLIYSQYNAKVEYTHFLTGPQIHKPYYTYSRGFDLVAQYNHNRFNRARDEVINPRGGRKVQIRYDRFVNFFLDEFVYVGFLKEKYKKYPYNRYFVNWVERVPVPKTKKHTLLFRGQLNLIDRKVDDFYEEQLGGPNQMRGYTFYSLSGRKSVMGQMTYRFPLWYDMNKSIGAWNFNHIYFGFFTDIGRAWNKRSLNWSTKDFKRDAGIELRLDATSFYNFPTMIEFAMAYGPDDTWIKQFDSENSSFYIRKDDQDPLKFFFTVLFGFAQ